MKQPGKHKESPQRSPKVEDLLNRPPHVLLRYGTIAIIIVFTILLLVFGRQLPFSISDLLDRLLP